MIRGLFHRPRHLTGVPVAEIHERLHNELIPVVFGGTDNMQIVRRSSDGEQFLQWTGAVLRVPTNWEPESNPGHFIITPPDALDTIPALIGGALRGVL